MSLEHRDEATGEDTAVGLPSLKYRDDTVVLERRRGADFSAMPLRRPTKVCLQPFVRTFFKTETTFE